MEEIKNLKNENEKLKKQLEFVNKNAPHNQELLKEETEQLLFNLFPMIPKVFLPLIGIKSGSMYMVISFKEDLGENDYHTQNMRMNTVSETLALAFGFNPNNLIGKYVSTVSPNYSKDQLEIISKVKSRNNQIFFFL